VALVHDWLTGMRGGEKVLEVLCEAYPRADIFTLVHRRGSVSSTIERHSIRTSFLQWLPGAASHYRRYLPVFPFAVEQFNLDAYDFVISTSHCAAKGVIRSGRARHLCYCFSPMRYAWDQFDAYFGPLRAGALASRWFYRPTLAKLARWDRATSVRVDRFVAISAHVAGRIRRYYNRQATVVYPPVDTVYFHPASVAPERQFLIVSALVPYKRLDLAIDACAELGVPLRIVGEGPERRSLEARAGADTTFLGWLSNEEIRAEYRRAAAVILPGEEDFGIVPVEAQACGRPVVAFGRGGARETILDGDTGLFFDEPTAASLAGALGRLSTMTFDSARIRAHAERFSRQAHQRRLQAVLDDTMSAPPGSRW
jgi:glycosyltransferase involved in cell wall biosynthesis